jgi:UDP-glucose 4-epimerase
MKMLVTGGAGFIGSHLVDALLERGHRVAIIDNMITGQKDNINPDARFYEIDIRNKEIQAIFEKEKFDVVFHQAAQLDVRKSVSDPGYDADVNIIGTLNLLQASVATGVKQFLFASSGGAMYGEQVEYPASEEHSCWPSSPYGVTKLSCERYIYYYGLAYGLNFQLMRYANVYGPRQNAHGEAGVVAIFSDKFLDGEQPLINGDGKQTRDFVYVHDVVRANLLAMESAKNDYFNVGTGIETDVNEIFRILNEASGANMPEKHGEAKAGEQMRSVLSYQKAKRILGWQPLVSLQKGLAETVAYFREKHLEWK